MKINNAGEFYHFVKNNQLVGLTPEILSLVTCIDEFGRMCACDTIQAKHAKQTQCRALYITFVSKAIQHRNVLLSKTPDNTLIFTIDGQHIVTLSR